MHSTCPLVALGDVVRKHLDTVRSRQEISMQTPSEGEEFVGIREGRVEEAALGDVDVSLSCRRFREYRVRCARKTTDPIRGSCR